MTRPINVAVLGATGSIGQQTLDVIDRNPSRLRLFGLTEGRRSTRRSAEYLVQGQAGDPEFDAQVEAMVTDLRCDVVVVAIPGARALSPTLAALKAGKEVALATKEVLVMAGDLVMRAAGAGRAQGAFPDKIGIRPVDSEHSAIWQCLWGERRESVRRLIITASGGPFWAHPDLDLDHVTVEQALNHPRWSMGPKVTVDSATLMNKGLEVIEAHHLFGIPLDQVTVCVHPQSVVHSLVEFVDGSLKAQLGRPDMRLPISVALCYPERLPDAVLPTPLEELSGLEFHALDEKRFPSVRLAREAAAAGQGRPAVLNAANEEAVSAFLAGEIPFSGIVRAVDQALAAFQGGGDTLQDILEADRWAREYVQDKKGSPRRDPTNSEDTP
jgi:1-deoxy-D-xylulose-5-phosphate reductoisomerase